MHVCERKSVSLRAAAFLFSFSVDSFQLLYGRFVFFFAANNAVVTVALSRTFLFFLFYFDFSYGIRTDNS